MSTGVWYMCTAVQCVCALYYRSTLCLQLDSVSTQLHNVCIQLCIGVQYFTVVQCVCVYVQVYMESRNRC